MTATAKDIPGRRPGVTNRDPLTRDLERRAPIDGPVAGPEPELPAVEAPSLLPPPGKAAEAFQGEAVTLLVGAVGRPDVAATAVAHRRPLPTVLDLPDGPAENLMRGWRLIACVLLPFAAGFFISYLFRSINALISGELTSDLGLGAGDLGLLTSVFFLTFAVVGESRAHCSWSRPPVRRCSQARRDLRRSSLPGR
jgi:hypothetical protein